MRVFTLPLSVVVLTGLATAAKANPWFMEGQTLGPEFTIAPSVPGHDDIIQFHERYEAVLRYTCSWEFPAPRLSVDRETKVVEVRLEPSWQPEGAEGCAMVESTFPVSGLEGTFGPLEPGLWEYRSGLSSKVHYFTVVPEPGLTGLGTMLLARLLVRRPRRRARRAED